MILYNDKNTGNRSDQNIILSKAQMNSLLLISRINSLNRIYLKAKITKKCAIKFVNKIYEDRDLILFNKPSDLITHYSKTTKSTFMRILLKYYKSLFCFNNINRPGILHRLDKQTSGLLLIAKSRSAHLKLYKQIMRQSIDKKYLTIVYGIASPLSGRIKKEISCVKKTLITRSLCGGGGCRLGITSYKTINIYNKMKLSLLECKLITGVTHQIRAHMQYNRTPVIGDCIYKKLKKGEILDLKGQALHAYKISFIHPTSLQLLQFSTSLNAFMSKIICVLRILS